MSGPCQYVQYLWLYLNRWQASFLVFPRVFIRGDAQWILVNGLLTFIQTYETSLTSPSALRHHCLSGLWSFLLTVQKQQLQALNPSWICYDWRNFIKSSSLYSVCPLPHCLKTNTYLTLTLTSISPLCNASMPLFDQQQHFFGCTKWSNSSLKIYLCLLIIVIVTLCKLTENRLTFFVLLFFS